MYGVERDCDPRVAFGHDVPALFPPSEGHRAAQGPVAPGRRGAAAQPHTGRCAASVSAPGTVGAVELQPGSAAPLVGSPRADIVHALTDWGHPCCMAIFKPPIYPVNVDMTMRAEHVPVSQRCHRYGCAEMWPAVD